MGILLIPRFCSGSIKTVLEFLVLVRGNFLLYHLKAYLYGFILGVTLINFVPSLWLKID